VGASGAEEVEERLAELSFVPEIYSPHALSVDAELLSAVHDRGMTLIPWTVNDPDEMRHLIALGVDGLITDYPDRAQAVLRKSGR
jgi:glycerophosphoryl diester phosphodiesterase